MTEVASKQVPTVHLADKDWEIPVLAPKQNKVIVPILVALIPRVVAARAAGMVDPSDETKGINLARVVIELIGDAKTYDDLSVVVYTALTRANPALTREEFDNMPVDTMEMVAALTCIGQQAGLLRK